MASSTIILGAKLQATIMYHVWWRTQVSTVPQEKNKWKEIYFQNLIEI
jgi:hypothetical protein